MDKILEPWVKCKSEASLEKLEVQFTTVVVRDARRCFLSGRQLRTKKMLVHVESTREFSHTTT